MRHPFRMRAIEAIGSSIVVMSYLRASRLLLFIAALLACSPAVAVRWDFRPGGSPMVELPDSGTEPVLGFVQDEQWLTASAWTAAGRARRLTPVPIVRFDDGLVACNPRGRGDCGGTRPPGQGGRVRAARDWILLSFDEEFEFENLSLSSSASGHYRLSYWIGSIASVSGLERISTRDLEAAGFGPRTIVSGRGPDPIDVALGNVSGNALLIGGFRSRGRAELYLNAFDASPKVVPLPPTAIGFGSGLGVLLFTAFRRSHRSRCSKG